LHKTDPSRASPTVDVSLYDDYESSLPLDTDSTVDTPLTDLEKVIDPSLSSLSYVASSLSSTPRDTAIGDLTLLASPLPLAQCTGLEMGESSNSDASFIKGSLLDWSNGPILMQLFLEKALFEELYGDGMVVSSTPSIKHIHPICTEPLALAPISSPLLSTTASHLHAFYRSLSDIKGYNFSFKPCCAHLEDMPKKFKWTTFFYHCFDFSLAFDECKRTLLLSYSFSLTYITLRCMQMAHDKLL